MAVCANSLEAAQENLGHWNHVLRSELSCELKFDSLQAVPARTKALGSQRVHDGGVVWEVLDEVKCLGSWVSGVGSDRTDLRALMSAWTRAFWANSRLLTNSRASNASKFRAFKALIYSVGDHLWLGLRPGVTKAQALDTHINKLCRRILRLPRLEGEEIDVFAIRRMSAISDLKAQVGIDIRGRWATKLVSYVEHCHRHKLLPWCFMNSQTDRWLREQRAKIGKFGSSRKPEGGETGTRAGLGYPWRWAERWYEGVGCSCGRLGK